MKNTKVIGVMREKKFSPNHIENDAEIMKAVAGEMYKSRLRRQFD